MSTTKQQQPQPSTTAASGKKKFGGAGGNKSGAPRATWSQKANLQISVSRVRSIMKRGRYAKHLGATASVYVSSIIEYIAAEILELSGKAAKANKRNRITARHITLAVRNDEDLCMLFKNSVISGGGVLPSILPQLQPLRKLKQAAKKQAKKSAEKPDGASTESAPVAANA